MGRYGQFWVSLGNSGHGFLRVDEACLRNVALPPVVSHVCCVGHVVGRISLFQVLFFMCFSYGLRQTDDVETMNLDYSVYLLFTTDNNMFVFGMMFARVNEPLLLLYL